MKNDGSITFGIVMGLTIFTLTQAIVFTVVSGEMKEDCLKDGGVYTKGQTIAGITYKSCTYTK